MVFIAAYDRFGDLLMLLVLFVTVLHRCENVLYGTGNGHVTVCTYRRFLPEGV